MRFLRIYIMLTNPQVAVHAAIQTFNYEGTPVSFAKGENTMVNATEMAKPFGKVAKDWLKNQSAQDFITSLSAVRRILPSELVVSRKGGTEQGTWMHEDVAIEFARWLSPKFAIWCNDRIKELARDGVAVINDDDAVIAHAIQVLQKRLDAKTQQVQILQGENQHLQLENKALAPKAQYTDEVLQSTSTVTFTEAAKELNFRSATALINRLLNDRVIYRQSGRLLPTAKYSGKGFFTSRTHRFYHTDGTPDASVMTVVTQKGRAFLYNYFFGRRAAQ